MKIQNWTRLNRDGRLAEAPEWVDEIIDALNDHMERLTTALQGRLGVENENAVILELEMIDREETAISIRDIRGPVREVSILQVLDGTAWDGLGWYHRSSEEIVVRPLFHGSPSDAKLVRLKLKGD